MTYALPILALFSLAVAFPNLASHPRLGAKVQEISQRSNPRSISKAETNCGPTPCLTFSKSDQLVSVSGKHAYRKPTSTQIRGPCPGLNAAANHGYLPRSGIVTLADTITGLEALYNMAPEVAAFLGAYAIALDGNVLDLTWSIGGPLPSNNLSQGLVGTGQGISYSHNNYEGDTSIGRNDAYINNGDAHSLNISKFASVYALRGPEDRFTLDKFRQRFESVQDESITNNPYYFTGLFSTVVVVPAAYNFVINFMSNHSANEPSGYLDGNVFKQFFGVSGEPGSFVWNKGQERIPKNWYRRPTISQYTAEDVILDVGIGYSAYPQTLRIGGNTGTTNSFTGVSISNLTGGVYSAKTLFSGNNFACFAYQLLLNGLPDFVQSGLGNLTAVETLVGKYLAPILAPLGCPQLTRFNQGLLDVYPGRRYSPTGNDTNY